jgi:hypothetical protein
MLVLAAALAVLKRRKSRSASSIAFSTNRYYILGAGRDTGPYFLGISISMLTSDGAFQNELRKLIAEKINNYKDMLAINNYTSVAEFRYVMGRIAALSDLEEMMDEAKKAAEQRNR